MIKDIQIPLDSKCFLCDSLMIEVKGLFSFYECFICSERTCYCYPCVEKMKRLLGNDSFFRCNQCKSLCKAVSENTVDSNDLIEKIKNDQDNGFKNRVETEPNETVNDMIPSHLMKYIESAKKANQETKFKFRPQLFQDLEGDINSLNLDEKTTKNQKEIFDPYFMVNKKDEKFINIKKAMSKTMNEKNYLEQINIENLDQNIFKYQKKEPISIKNILMSRKKLSTGQKNLEKESSVIQRIKEEQKRIFADPNCSKRKFYPVM